MNGARDLADVLDLLSEQGFRYERTDLGYRVFAKDGRGIVHMRKCREPRAFENTKSDLRRIGVNFPSNYTRPIRAQESEVQKVEQFPAPKGTSTPPSPAPLTPIQRARAGLQKIMDGLTELEEALGAVETDAKRLDALRALVRDAIT